MTELTCASYVKLDHEQQTRYCCLVQGHPGQHQDTELFTWDDVCEDCLGMGYDDSQDILLCASCGGAGNGKSPNLELLMLGEQVRWTGKRLQASVSGTPFFMRALNDYTALVRAHTKMEVELHGDYAKTRWKEV